jgi:hypothetical protein
MKVMDLFLISIYTHFCEMKERGRQVVPWFQTAFAISLFSAISGFLVVKLFFGNTFNNQTVPESSFLAAFLLIGCLCFFLIKRYLFDSQKNIVLSEKYVQEYSSQKRLQIKVISISAFLLIPILLGFAIWFRAR